MLLKLNLPEFAYKIRKEQGNYHIFDVVRKKYLRLFPEEWVRQHFVHFLLKKGYPKSLIKIEGGHQFNAVQKRSDILVYQADGKPFLLVECKASYCKLDEEVFKQMSVYNLSQQAPFVVLTNGLTHLYFAYDKEKNTYEQLGELPDYE